MAEVGLAFLSASLSVLFDRMASPEVVDFMQGRKLTVRLSRKLKTAMRSVNAVLADAEEKQLTNPLVKDWVDELKDVLFDAEDILDEIATEALQRKLDAESSTTAEKVLDCISNTFLDTFVNEVEQKIKEVLDRLDDLVKEKDCMGLQVGVGGKQYPDQRLSTSYVSESNTFGRDEDKKKVVDLLLSSDARGNEMCVIAIVGMGGIGKTTLAQLAYNDNRVEQHFNLKIWFCVSAEFVVPNVMKSIINQSATSSAPSTEDLEQLRVIVKKNLTGKKFLLVLDDVWSEKPDHRELLGQFLQYGARGSKILVTTRNESVALAMKAIATHHLELLQEDDCWSLFEKHAFRNGSSNADPKIKEIGTQIVSKCKGLPLAIKAIGDLLWSESNVERWTNILESNLWDLPMEGTDILPALRLSYKYLPSYLKRCFAYCSMFPKDHIFEKDQLVLLWMAEGFLQQSEILTMEEVGNRCFDVLVSRSLFQHSSWETKSRFVMHDFVNDLAKSVAGQFGTDSLTKIVKMTRYVSNFGKSCGTVQDREDDLLKAKQLRTFLAKDFSGVQIEKIKITILCLRVLSIGNIGLRITKLLDSIGEMKYLRYLDVSSLLNLNYLPNSICNLCNLQTLKLSDCWELDRLPRDMWKLINLRHLEIDRTDKLKEMPIKMGRLNCLQTLSKFVISKHDSASGSSIGELGKLKNLRGILLIQELQNVRSADEALDASLKTKGYLEELVLEWKSPQEVLIGTSESQRGVLENLQPHENLKSLSIKYYGGKGFPDWIGGLTSLSKLKLFNCNYCSALPSLGQLPFLEKLWIKGLHRVVNVDLEFYGNSSNSSMKPFGSLKFLRLENMSNWENWFYLGVENEVETFSQLERLFIGNCPKLRGRLPVYLPQLEYLYIGECPKLRGRLPVYLPSLDKLQVMDCQHEHDGLLSKLKILEINDFKKCELPMHSQFSSLEVLLLKDCCDSLTSFPLDLFPNLKGIRIEGCMNLQSLEQHGGDVVISEIGIWRCPNFVSFPKGGLRAPNLEMFSLGYCESLRSMPRKMHLFLPSLYYLKLINCPEVELFPEEGFPSNLKIFEILTCKKLITNLCKETLPHVEWLKIGNEELEDHVESFPGELLLPTTLHYLCIKSIGNLKSLDKEEFQHLTSLVRLEIIGCQKLRCMPEEGFPTSLRFLNICGSPALVEELKDKTGEEWLKVARVPNITIDYKQIQGERIDWIREHLRNHQYCQDLQLKAISYRNAF